MMKTNSYTLNSFLHQAHLLMRIILCTMKKFKHKVWSISSRCLFIIRGSQVKGAYLSFNDVAGEPSKDFALGPEHTGHFVQPHVAAHCGGDIYSRRKQLFSSFGEHTAVCGSSMRQAVARPRHRQSVCIHNIHVAATCRPSVLGFATRRGHMWLNKVASVLGPL